MSVTGEIGPQHGRPGTLPKGPAHTGLSDHSQLLQISTSIHEYMIVTYQQPGCPALSPRGHWARGSRRGRNRYKPAIPTQGTPILDVDLETPPRTSTESVKTHKFHNSTVKPLRSNLEHHPRPWGARAFRLIKTDTLRDATEPGEKGAPARIPCVESLN